MVKRCAYMAIISEYKDSIIAVLELGTKQLIQHLLLLFAYGLELNKIYTQVIWSTVYFIDLQIIAQSRSKKYLLAIGLGRRGGGTLRPQQGTVPTFEVIGMGRRAAGPVILSTDTDRKSTRLNSSHITISYAVFCLK